MLNKFKLLKLKKNLKSCRKKLNDYLLISNELLIFIDEELIEEVINNKEGTQIYISLLNYKTFFSRRLMDINDLIENINNLMFKRLLRNKRVSYILVESKCERGNLLISIINNVENEFTELFINEL